MPRSMACRAFSLIEMVIAAAFIAGSFLLLMDTWPVCGRAVAQSRKVAIASHIAETRMEQAISQGALATAPAPGSVNVTSQVNGVNSTDRFDYTVTLTAVGTDASNIVVNVRWAEGMVTHYVELESQVTLPY